MINLNLDKNGKYLLACSFGPDSMALFHLLYKNGFNFECAIVNYHLRKESDKEVSSLLEYASKKDIRVHVYDVNEKIAKNIEARCREIRYSFFKELCLKCGYDAVLVAHHQDDHIETYLLQKQRQNYPIFYGICEKTNIFGVDIIRPLLSFTKKELLDICINNNVPFSIDQSNFDTKLKRNKIRQEVIGNLSQTERLKILKQIDRENQRVKDILDTINIDKLCEVDYINTLDIITVSYALNFYAKKLDQKLFLSSTNVGQVLTILKSKKPNGQFPIKNGIYLIKEYDKFYFSLFKLTDIDYEYILNKPSLLNTDYFYLDFTGDTSNRNVSLNDYPLIIRHLKKEDLIFINGYKVKGSRLLIDWKVPFRKRLIWPVIVNKSGVCIYVPRYQKDFIPNKDINFYVK